MMKIDRINTHIFPTIVNFKRFEFGFKFLFIVILILGGVFSSPLFSAVSEKSGDEKTSFAAYFNPDGSPNTKYMATRYYESYLKVAADPVIFSKIKNKHSGNVILSCLHLWKATGEDRYLQKSKELFEILLTFAPENRDIYEDCFGCFLAFEPGAILKRSGQFDPKWESRYRKLILNGMEAFKKFTPNNDGNQELARLSAIACASSLYPQEPGFLDARTKSESVWKKIMKQGDVPVDSKTYAPVSFRYIFALAVELNHLDELVANEGIHRQMKNYATLVSPNGFLPEFGHGYFRRGDMEDWLWMLEIGAALYQDPSILGPARKLYASNVRMEIAAPRREDEAIQSVDYFVSSLINPNKVYLYSAEIDRCVAQPTLSSEASVVTYRAKGAESKVPEFMILRTGVQPGDNMIMMDLLSSGDHCQKEFRSSIAYYESNHVPQFWQYGRHFATALAGNLLLLKSSKDDFPGGGWNKNTWRTIVVPLERLTGEGKNRIIPSIGLRTYPGKNSITIDNIRLVGANGEKKLFDFENGNEGWGRKNTTCVKDATSGNFGLKIDLVNTGTGSGPMNLSVDVEEYSALLIDMKWEGDKMPKVQVRPSGVEAWVNCEDDVMLTKVKSAKAEMHGKDCRGEVVFSSHGTADSSLTRQIVLTEEGYLFIRDDFNPGKTAVGMNAGMLWQMYSLQESGSNWFNSHGEYPYASADIQDSKLYSQGMLAWFAGPKEQTFGKMTIKEEKSARTPHADENWKNTDWNVAWSCEKITSEKSLYFNLVVIPHLPAEDPALIASGISAEQDSSSSIFHYKKGSKNITVTISKNSPWKVER